MTELSTSELWRTIQALEVPAGHAAFWWLYQAGFAIKSPGGAVILIDPYLSDAVLRSYNQPRNVPPPLDPHDADADAVLASHTHEDHLDPDALDAFASHPQTKIIGPQSVVDVALSHGVHPSQTIALDHNHGARVNDIDIECVYARHTFDLEPTPDAVGFLINVGGVRLYHTGDTEYDAKILVDTKGRVDVSLVCINGTTGNMNAHEAALLVWQQGAALAVPMHYGLWRDADYGEGATLDPSLFADTLRRLDPTVDVQIVRPGKLVLVSALRSADPHELSATPSQESSAP